MFIIKNKKNKNNNNSSLKKDPKKITETEQLTEKKLNIKTIPLKIKPIKSPHTINDTNLKNKSTIKIIAVFALFIINFILIINLVSIPEEPNISYSTKKKEVTSNVLGSWTTPNESLFVFNDDYSFYWYESYKDQNNNYYAGTYNYKQGSDALTEMGYTTEEFTKTFGEDIKIDNVYSLNIFPTISYKGNKDTSTKDLKENESWWFIIIKKDNNTAIAYNKTLDIRYELTLN